LYLVENNIRDEGVEALVKAIRVNPTLKVLDVRMNNLTRKGFELLTNQMYNYRPRMSIRYGELENN
jgi:Ran GTPase-activating protein (RanGAP) involved in mRNA processing and transport